MPYLDDSSKDIDDKDSQVIRAWSNSRLDTFESCPRRAELAYKERIPEPDRGAPPGRLKEWPNDRGARVHEYAERFVRGEETRQIAEMKAYEPEFNKMRDLYRDGRVICEQGWGFDQDWDSVDYKDYDRIWARIVIDALVFLTPTSAVVIDYKTGKRVFNEVKHAKQTQIYQAATFIRYPQLEEITTELWYLDQNELFQQTFTRSQGLRFLKGITQRATAMTTATEFPAKPNVYACRYCPYKTGMIGKHGPQGTGHCDKNPV